ncbi:MAG: hypothetical protein K2X91_13560 [Thermoleophilia bacterium]|nr:hypothetical protein [Thermoleophilia bacterium]
MTTPCPECGAPVPEGGDCRDHFHALLLLEGEIPGVPGSLDHFYVVSTYALQHPEGMRLNPDALKGLRSAVADALAGRADVPRLRERSRTFAEGPARVALRPGEAPHRWPVASWPMTVADVCTAETFGEFDTPAEFSDRVRRWAASVVATLDAAGA